MPPTVEALMPVFQTSNPAAAAANNNYETAHEGDGIDPALQSLDLTIDLEELLAHYYSRDHVSDGRTMPAIITANDDSGNHRTVANNSGATNVATAPALAPETSAVTGTAAAGTPAATRANFAGNSKPSDGFIAATPQLAAVASAAVTSAIIGGGDSKSNTKQRPLAEGANVAASSSSGQHGGGVADDRKTKLERQRVRNREAAKRTRIRKKRLLESLQDQNSGLQDQIDKFKKAIRGEVPAGKAERLIEEICGRDRRRDDGDGENEKYERVPMPSGFGGPVKTFVEPDLRLVSALSGTQQNFVVTDPTLQDNPIVRASRGFLDLTGYRLDQVLGKNCRFLQGPGTDRSTVDVIRESISKGDDASVCLLNYKADGTPFWNQIFVAPLRDVENKIVNYVSVQCEVSKAVVETANTRGRENKNAKKRK